MGHVYNLLLWLLAPVLIPYLAYRALQRGHGWGRLGEKFGYLPHRIRQSESGAIWVHAVSVGEALACAQLLPALRRRFPHEKIFVSTGTPTGQQQAEQQLGKWADGFFYAPHDFPWAVDRALRSIRPRLLIVMETEIWPNLFRRAKASGAGVLLVNGRISDRSAPRYRKFRWFFGPALEACDQILAQSDVDAARFEEAGAPSDAVVVGGNLKYDFEAGEAQPPAAIVEFLRKVRPKIVLLAGSTREGEEEMAAAAFAQTAAEQPDALLMVAPRHPQRFDEAARALAAGGLPVVRRSQLPGAVAPSLPAVLLVDTLGELASLYALADAVFVGGSLNGWGGHNALEPALAGKPVVVGPHMQNFREITERLLAADGLEQIQRADELAPVWLRWLRDPAGAAALGARGKAVAEAARGAGERAASAAVEAWTAAAPPRRPAWWKRCLLGPLAALWAAGARLHAEFYAAGLLRQARLPRFTLVVGNLTAGGAGKTPTTLRLAEQLALRGLQPAILTRGYRRRSSAAVTLSLPDKPRGPEEIGDEAWLLQERLTEVGLPCPIGVSGDRTAAGRRVLEEAEADLFLLDDGLQHHRLARDFNLVLIDVTQPLFFESPLPLGRRREALRALGRAQAILLTRTVSGCRYEDLRRRIRRVSPQAPVFQASTAPVETRAAGRIASRPLRLDELSGTSVFAFCGLGAPEGFWRTLEAMGCRLAGRRAFPDHHRYRLDDWWRIAAEARASGAEIMLTSEKDLPNLEHDVPQEMRTGAPPLYALVIEQRIEDEPRLLDLIEAAVERRRAESR